MIYYVYKFRITGTKMFYIGATSSLEKRRPCHINGILNAIRRIKDDLPIDSSRFTYIPIAYHFISHKDVDKMDFFYMAKKCVFEVIDIKDTVAEAAELEGKLLNRYKKNPNLLNIQTSSHYVERRTRPAKTKGSRRNKI